MRDLPWGLVGLAACLAVLFVGVWGWQQRLQQQLSAPKATEPWQHVREQHPMPASFKPAPDLAPDFLKTVVRANPFSPQRRQTPQEARALEEPVPIAEPAAPQFLYKGRVMMGAKQRAVLEDLSRKKTHFLQVGQEVAGFKVLDITETQVVLSTPNSQEPLVISLTPKEGAAGIKKATVSSGEGKSAP